MLNFDNFEWGNLSQNEIEFFKKKSTTSYNRFFDVEPNDIVVDLGAFVGSFTYGILDRNPQHVWVMEPIREHFRNLYKNLKNHQVSFTRAGISNDKEIEIEWTGVTGKAQGIKFKDFIENNCIDKIDFFKCDCEGGEYIILNDENINYITQNVKKIACEFHLNSPEKKEKFRYFRDNILQHFDTYHVYSIDGVDIKWDLFNEHFLEYYREVIFLIDNRNYNNIEEQRFWNNPEEWSREGEEWSDVFGGTEKTWNEIIYPKIKNYFGETLEIAPGHGRITNYLLKYTNNLSIIDLNENCIKSCKEKFGHKIKNYVVNNGKSLEFFEDNSIDFVISWDSFVHMDKHVIKNYLHEIYRILKINGVGYIHHSFFSGDIESKKNVAGRSNMNPDLFKELCQEAGLELISQEDLIGNVTDTISIFRKNESTL